MHVTRNRLRRNRGSSGMVFTRCSGAALSGLCVALSLGDMAVAQTSSEVAAPPTAEAQRPSVSVRRVATKTVHKHVGTVTHNTEPKQDKPVSGLSPSDQARAAAIASTPARFDKPLGLKGWDIHFPSYGDSILQDYGGFRSKLAENGFGIMLYDAENFAVNTLNGPTNGPGSSNGPGRPIERQQYWGQRADILSVAIAQLFYDTSRWGVPDGQIGIGGQFSDSGKQHQVADKFSMSTLYWYQTLFNKKLEIKIGYVYNGLEFVGNYIGGNLASPFGPSSFIPYEMGLITTPGTQPTARTTWHMTDELYNEAAVIRSNPIGGPSGDVFYDDAHYNPTGFRFSVPNGRALFIDELGYKNEAAPGKPQTWARFGGIYNTSKFTNYQNGGTTSGVGAMYALADRQVFQSEPDSVFTAYKGLYAGASFMYAPPETNAVSAYAEGRLYYIAPFASRPKDQAVLVYSHNFFSKYVADAVNQYSDFTGQFGHHASNSVTAAYTANIVPGVYFTVGAGYTDNPSLSYTKGEGHALNFLAGSFLVF